MHKVMIVDDNMTNLIMAKKALEELYEIVPVNSGEMALEFLRDMPEPPDLLLLDVDMPNVNGFYVISEMKNNNKLANIPVIFLTAQDDETTEVEGYFLGAIDYIRKPYTTALLQKRLDIHIRLLESERRLKNYNNTLSQTLKEKTHNIVELQYAIVEMFIDLMEKRDMTAGFHARRVEKYMDVFLREVIKSGKFSIYAEDVEGFIFASKIHDIGKISISDRGLLTNVADLSLQEVEELKSHTLLGAEAIQKVIAVISQNSFLNYAYNMCRFHHERWDGKGYPDKKLTTDIPEEARILAIVNSYDEFRTKNDGRKPLTHEEAINRIRLWSGTYFDPDLVELFLAVEKDIERASLT